MKSRRVTFASRIDEIGMTQDQWWALARRAERAIFAEPPAPGPGSMLGRAVENWLSRRYPAVTRDLAGTAEALAYHLSNKRTTVTTYQAAQVIEILRRWYAER